MLDRSPNAKPVNIVHALLLELDRNILLIQALCRRGNLRAVFVYEQTRQAQQAIYENDAIAIIRSLQALKKNQLEDPEPAD